MSNVKEECEDISVMEATGLKTEDQQMDKGKFPAGDVRKAELKLEAEQKDILQDNIKEEHKPEVKLFQEECPKFQLLKPE
ncbi:hypothetical protein AOLI_G00232850 [Acnodon oligacanthus]